MLIRRRTLLAATAATAVAGPALAQNYPRRADPVDRRLSAGRQHRCRRPHPRGGRRKGPRPDDHRRQQGRRRRPDRLHRNRPCPSPTATTLGFLNLPAVNTIILDPERKAAFNVDSFIPIVNQVLDPGLIWVKGDSPYKTLADLTEAARKAPGKISACTTGILSDDHLAILMVQEAAKCEFRIVHFDGGAQQITGVLGGHVDCAFDNVGGVFKRVQSGEVRGLAVTDVERSKFLPQVPCTKELGLPTVISSSTRGVGAPKGTPADVVKVVETAFLKAIKSPEMLQKMDAVGLALKPMVGAEYAKYYADTQAQAKKYTEWALKQR